MLLRLMLLLLFDLDVVVDVFLMGWYFCWGREAVVFWWGGELVVGIVWLLMLMVDAVEVNVVENHVAAMYLSLMWLVIVGDGGQRLCSDPKFIRLITCDPGLVCIIIVLYLQ